MDKRKLNRINEQLNGISESKYKKSSIKKDWIAYLELLPCFAFLCVFLVYPAVDAIRKSFYYWKISDFNNPKFVGLENYVDVIKDSLFWRSSGILSIMVIWGIFLTVGIIMPVSYLVYKLGEGYMGKFVQRAFVIPMTIPTMVFLLFWRFMYEPNYGLLNSILRNIGLENFTRLWLGDEKTALPALIFMNFPWISACGFNFLILLAGFQLIDKSLHEAADIDGAKNLVKFFRIDIPMIIPQIKVLLILNLISGMQQYSYQLVMTQGGPNYSTTVPGLLLYFTAFQYGDLGKSSTIGVILFIVIMAITLLFNKTLKSKA